MAGNEAPGKDPGPTVIGVVDGRNCKPLGVLDLCV
jgi:hypothetical protein